MRTSNRIGGSNSAILFLSAEHGGAGPFAGGPQRAQLSGVSMIIAFKCRDVIRGGAFGDPDIFRSCVLAQGRSRARPWAAWTYT